MPHAATRFRWSSAWRPRRRRPRKAPGFVRRGRGFKSRHPDQVKPQLKAPPPTGLRLPRARDRRPEAASRQQRSAAPADPLGGGVRVPIQGRGISDVREPTLIGPAVTLADQARVGIAMTPRVGEIDKAYLVESRGELSPESREALDVALRAALDL